MAAPYSSEHAFFITLLDEQARVYTLPRIASLTADAANQYIFGCVAATDNTAQHYTAAYAALDLNTGELSYSTYPKVTLLGLGAYVLEFHPNTHDIKGFQVAQLTDVNTTSEFSLQWQGGMTTPELLRLHCADPAAQLELLYLYAPHLAYQRVAQQKPRP